MNQHLLSGSEAGGLDPVWNAASARAVEYLTIFDDDYRVLYVNRVQAGVEQAIGRSILEFLPTEERPIFRICVRRMLETGMPQHWEAEATGSDGRSAHYSSWIVPYRGWGGRARGMIIGTDVSHHRRVSKELASRDGLFRSIAENSPVFIAALAEDGSFAFVSGATDGLPAGELKSIDDLFAPEEQGRVRASLAAVFAGGRPQAFDAEIRGNGERRRFAIRIGPIHEGDFVASALLIASDRSRVLAVERSLRKSEERLAQARKMEAIGNLTGGIAHDFNNLLCVIQGNLHLALEDPNDLTLIQDALEASERAAALTQRLLAFARKQRLRPRVIALPKLVQGMMELLRRSLPDAMELRVEAASDLGRCHVDPVALEQVILNLVLNARDAIEGEGTITIAMENAALDESEFIALRIADTGCGMEESVREAAFEPFFTTKEAGRGTGLGLSTAYGFVQQSGGYASIESEPGEGCCVSLLLPRTHQPLESDAVAAEPKRKGGEEHVLLVEDEPAVLRVNARRLEALGYRYTPATQGEEALAALEADPSIDLLFTDLGLPGGMNGIEVAERALKMRPELRVLLTSAYPKGAFECSPRLEDVPLLKKPFSDTDLARALRSVIEAED